MMSFARSLASRGLVAVDRAGLLPASDVVCVRLTNGFGNNLFQYVAARLLAEQYGLPLRVQSHRDYYGLSELRSLGLDLKRERSNRFDRTVRDATYADAARGPDPGVRRYVLRGHFEDYRHYLDHLDRIRSWFRPVERLPARDLAIHFRTGDRLFMREEFDSKPRVADYLAALEHFDFDRLHIVSDLPAWKPYTAKELRSLSFHVDVPPDEAVPIERSVEYVNEFVEGLASFSPIFRSTSPAADFDYLRGFDNLLFEHGTLSWWAAVIGAASNVGVYGPWRPWRGESNRNLSQVPLPGWFNWERLPTGG